MSPSSSRRRPLWVAALLVLACACAAVAAPGSAWGAKGKLKVHTVKPAKVAKGVAVYRLPKLRPASVRRVVLRNANRTRRLGVRRLRRALPHRRLRMRVAPGRRVAKRNRLHASRTQRPRVRAWKLVIVARPQPPAPPSKPAPGAPTAGAWRPYADSSPFNRPLGDDPRVAQESAAMVARLASFGPPDNVTFGNTGSEWDFSHPVYWSGPGDPVFTLHCYESSWGRCPIEGHQVRIPDAAKPAAGDDAHLTIVDRDSGWEYDLYKVRSKPAGGGVLEFRWGGRTRIDGDGLGSGATVSGFGNLAGIVRAEELEAGEIRHALFMVVKCSSGRAVFPAGGGAGTHCSELGISQGDAPAMGTRFQLTLSPGQIAALDVPGWKKTLLRAMATYGLYVGDTGGGAWGIQMESGASQTSFGLEDPFVAFGRKHGLPTYRGKHVMHLRDGVDWAKHLRAIDPCEAQGTC